MRLNIPPALETDPVALLAAVEAVEVTPDVGARVVINERTGTVVMGDAVRISKIALAHGNLTVEVSTDYFAICNADDLLPPRAGNTELVILAAAQLGPARLIDNIKLSLIS